MSSSGSTGLLVLQWLSYTFWGSTLLAMSALVYIVMDEFFRKSDYSELLLPYSFSATLVLLVVSLTCEYFFRRREAQKKTGISAAIVAIYAVIFAVFGIGALIGAVSSFVQAMVAADSYANAIANSISLLIISALYGLAFLRTINPFNIFKTALWFSLTMIVVSGVFIVSSIIGPLARASLSRNDSRLEDNLSAINDAINDYATDKQILPKRLSDVTSSVSREANQVINDGLVEYKIVDKKLYRYQLCVTYGQKNGEGSSSDDSDEYGDSYLDNYDHPAGNVSYKQQADEGYYYESEDGEFEDASIKERTDKIMPTALSQLKDVKYYLSYYGNDRITNYPFPTSPQWNNATFRKKYIPMDSTFLESVSYSPTARNSGGCSSFTISTKDEGDMTISLTNIPPGDY